MTLSRLNQPARFEVAALVAAVAGIVVQMIGGVSYPVIPPGVILLVVVAALVLFVHWRWAPLAGVLGGGFLLLGGVVATRSRYDLSHPGHPGAFAGTWIELAAVAVAVVAGLAALVVGRRQ
ncbi:MAG: hypothetical protein JO016_16680 [Actinobacteria bacterium]|nr:hypothetical protein [Actinomycetota bacterium]